MEIWYNGIQKHYCINEYFRPVLFSCYWLSYLSCSNQKPVQNQTRIPSRFNMGTTGLESVKVSVWIRTPNFEADMVWRLGRHKTVWLLALVLVRKKAHWLFHLTNAARKTRAQTNATLTKGTRSCDSTNVFLGQHALPEPMRTRSKYTSAGPIARDITAKAKPINARKAPHHNQLVWYRVSDRIGTRSC